VKQRQTFWKKNDTFNESIALRDALDRVDNVKIEVNEPSFRLDGTVLHVGSATVFQTIGERAAFARIQARKLIWDCMTASYPALSRFRATEAAKKAFNNLIDRAISEHEGYRGFVGPSS